MAVAKYKRCPQCGQHVSPTVIECPACEADLLGVPVADEELPPVQADPPRSALVRRCDCGAENPPQARKCAACGEDISDIVPAPAQMQQGCLAAELVSLDGQWKVAVSSEPVTLGREQVGSEYLRSRSYVSRVQARLEMKDGELQITSLSRSNPTFVNDVPMQTGEVRRLSCGDEIGLGGCVINGQRQEEAAYLTVQI